MKAFRYNTKKRDDRRFNNCGREKNPLAVKFYASNMKYADNYKSVYNRFGEFEYDCELEVAEIENINLFDMSAYYDRLTTFKNYFSACFSEQIAHMHWAIDNQKLKRDRKALEAFYVKFPVDKTILSSLIQNEFQQLSDFDMQLILVDELRSMGFDGYFTKNEIAIF